MTLLEVLVYLGVVYVALDLVTAFIYGRCVVPWLRCRACRKDAR